MRVSWTWTAMILFAIDTSASAEEASDAVRAMLRAEGLHATAVRDAGSDDPTSALWMAIAPTSVPLAVQRTIALHDRMANAKLGEQSLRIVEVRIADDARDLAIAIAWPDATEDRASTTEPAIFGDAVAIEIPLEFGAGTRLPHVAMGDEGRRVLLFFARAVEGGMQSRSLVAAGFGSSTTIDGTNVRSAMRYDRDAHAWRAVFVVPLAGPMLDLSRGLVPIAFANWDGSRKERAGNKALSSWRFIRIDRLPLDAPYAEELAFGHRPGDLGDAARGKTLVESVCVACHHIGDKRFAPPRLAPDLSNIGIIASASYLRDSITKPSEVIVASPNAAQHQLRTAAVGAVGAYPQNPMFAWSTRDDAGHRISKMPPFASFPPEDIAAMVAYLASLGRDGSTPKGDAK